jgi:hypothetical protein
MTEHELTSLPGYVARYWNADIPVLAITETAQGLVWTLLAIFSATLPVMQIFELSKMHKTVELQSIVEPEYS